MHRSLLDRKEPVHASWESFKDLLQYLFLHRIFDEYCWGNPLLNCGWQCKVCRGDHNSCLIPDFCDYCDPCDHFCFEAHFEERSVGKCASWSHRQAYQVHHYPCILVLAVRLENIWGGSFGRVRAQLAGLDVCLRVRKLGTAAFTFTNLRAACLANIQINDEQSFLLWEVR